MFNTVQMLLLERAWAVRTNFSLVILQFDRRACLSSLFLGFNGLFLTLAQFFFFSLNIFSLLKKKKEGIKTQSYTC